MKLVEGHGFEVRPQSLPQLHRSYHPLSRSYHHPVNPPYGSPPRIPPFQVVWWQVTWGWSMESQFFFGFVGMAGIGPIHPTSEKAAAVANCPVGPSSTLCTPTTFAVANVPTSLAYAHPSPPWMPSGPPMAHPLMRAMATRGVGVHMNPEGRPEAFWRGSW